jgi:AraC-like DNA-binding protein
MINYYDNASTKPEIFRQLSCKELLFVNYDCPLDTNKLEAWSHYNYIIYVVTGSKALHTADRSWLLTHKMAAFVKKGACIFEKWFDENLCLMVFFIPDRYLASFAREHAGLIQKDKLPPGPNELVIPLQSNDIMQGYYDSMIPYFFCEQKPSEDLLELKFRELLLNTISHSGNSDFTSYLHSQLLPQSDNLQAIIDANYHYNLKLEDYARLCNRSLSSFKRDFFKVYGTAPASWLLHKRIGYATQLLMTTGKSVNDICFESGFENSTHFSRVFKKQYGIAPLKYRLQANHANLPLV